MRVTSIGYYMADNLSFITSDLVISRTSDKTHIKSSSI